METPLEAWLDEKRVFPPDPAFLARWKEGKIFEKASKNRLAFWETCAEELLWIKRWDQVLEWNPPFAKWFLGGELNVSANCLDRHVNSPRRHKAALIWEGEDGKRRVITYQELHEEVCRLADGLASLGVKKNDRVAIYLPLIPEAVAAMLAVARLGAVHTVVFGGFSSEALKDRIQDAEASVLITADGGYRKGGIVPLKAMADKAASECPSLHHVVVVKRTGHPIEMRPGRDVDYGELIKNASPRRPPESVRAEDPLFILYTSGTTGKPKGILHSSAGYLLGVHMTMQWVFDIKPEDLFWCTADIGWITGHSYVVYGPLSNGATVMLYEGAPDWPTRDRFWQIIEKERVTLFYTAPTAIRTFMKWGRQEIEKHDLSSLRLLGTVGEPINPEAWMWYYHHVGGSKCPIVDTWWQTETGSIMIAPLPGVTPLKPGSATKPLPGIQAAILNEKGEPSKAGFLAITEPWPSMLSGIYKDPERYKATYWSKWDGRYYFTGDGAKIDDEGNFWLLGRVDDVINVSGHRIGTMEVESALVDHPLVAESAVVGVSDDIKGQALAAFVVIKERALPSPALKEELIEHVAEKIGPIARPRDLYFCRDLPKTRSGKIMRRLLRDIGEKRILGDLTTLADPTVMDELKKMHEEDLNP